MVLWYVIRTIPTGSNLPSQSWSTAPSTSGMRNHTENATVVMIVSLLYRIVVYESLVPSQKHRI